MARRVSLLCLIAAMAAVDRQILTISAGVVEAGVLDNEVIGQPVVECGPSSIQISVRTSKPFEGHIFARGRHHDPDCRNSQIGRHVTGITLVFGTCGLQRTRRLNSTGLVATASIVISFHPLFITEMDRFFSVQCFYSTPRRHHPLTNRTPLQPLQMPSCSYDVLEGGADGPPVVYASLGDPVYHRFVCQPPQDHDASLFCMVVHSCVIDGGSWGKSIAVLDSAGCSVDRSVIDDLEYHGDLSAGQKTSVVKYADRPEVFFRCQITLTVKASPEDACPRPICRRRRQRRIFGDQTMDVLSQRISTVKISILPKDDDDSFPYQLFACAIVSSCIFAFLASTACSRFLRT